MEGRAEIEKEKEWEKRVCYVKRGDFSHVIADSAPQPGCTRIYYFTRAWKTQQIKLWSCCLLEMDIFILDFGFSSLKSAFEIVSHQTVRARLWGYINPFLFEVSEQLTAAIFILSFLLSAVIHYINVKIPTAIHFNQFDGIEIIDQKSIHFKCWP